MFSWEKDMRVYLVVTNQNHNGSYVPGHPLDQKFLQGRSFRLKGLEQGFLTTLVPGHLYARVAFLCKDLAASVNGESCLWLSLRQERYYLASMLGPLIFGNSHFRVVNMGPQCFLEGYCRLK